MSDLDRRLNTVVQRRTAASVGDAERVASGVTVQFLNQVFRIGNERKVRTKLATCPILRVENGRNLYDLKTAAEYLLEPKVDVHEILKRLRPEQLPPAISPSFWQAQLSRQKFEENAGELWRTEKVREVLGSMFQTLKFTIQLWGDTIEREHGITDEQRETILRMSDRLQQDIYDQLVERARISATTPMIGEVPDMISAAEALPELHDDEDQDDEHDYI